MAINKKKNSASGGCGEKENLAYQKKQLQNQKTTHKMGENICQLLHG
jgi:hypothetical protein